MNWKEETGEATDCAAEKHDPWMRCMHSIRHWTLFVPTDHHAPLRAWHSVVTNLHVHFQPSYPSRFPSLLCPVPLSFLSPPWGRHPELNLCPLPQTQQPPWAWCSGPTHSLTRNSELQPSLSQSLPRCKAPAIPFSLPFSLPPPSPPSPTNIFRPHSEQGDWSTWGPLQQSCCFRPPQLKTISKSHFLSSPPWNDFC